MSFDKSIFATVLLFALVASICLNEARAEKYQLFRYDFLGIDLVLKIESDLGLNKEQSRILYEIATQVKNSVLEFLSSLSEKHFLSHFKTKARKFEQHMLKIKENFCGQIGGAKFSEQQLERTIERNMNFFIGHMFDFVRERFHADQDLSKQVFPPKFNLIKFDYLASDLIEKIFKSAPPNSEVVLDDTKLNGQFVDVLIVRLCKHFKAAGYPLAAERIATNLSLLKDAFSHDCA